MNTKFGFMKSIFNGQIAEQFLHNYPFFSTDQETEYSLMAKALDEWLRQNVDSARFEKEKRLPPEVMQGLKEMGLFGLIIPEKFGGSGMTQTLYTRTLELINRYDTSLALTVGAHSSIGIKGLYLFGTEKQKQQYMPRLATGELIASFALTEPTAGSDAARIKTRAVKQGDHYVINGSKLWITNGGFADFFTVFAKESIDGEEKISAFLVTRDMGGITHGPEEQKLGIKASSTVQVFFQDVKVPVENVLGKPGDGFKIAMAILNQGRVGLAGSSLGVMKALMRESLAYANNRSAFGHTIGEFALVQSMLVTMSTNIYASEAMIYLASHLVDTVDCDYSIEAAMCKVFVTEASWQNINLALQLHGGNGYMSEYGLERRLRDGRISLIFEGTNEILRLFIAMTGLKEIVSEYQKVGDDLHFFQHMKSSDFLAQAIGKIGFLSDFALKEVKKAVVGEKLVGFQSALEKECQRLSDAVRLLSSVSSQFVRNYGKELVNKQLQLARLADISIDVYMIAAVLARINTVLEHHGGEEKNATELAMAKLVIRNAKARINQNVRDIEKNKDEIVSKIAREVLKAGDYLFPMENVGK